MATLYISEYAHSTSGDSDTEQQEPAITDQTVAIGGTSTQSAAFKSNTASVRLQSDAICSFAFGANPTATATNKRMVAGINENFRVTPGHKVAVITNT